MGYSCAFGTHTRTPRVGLPLLPPLPIHFQPQHNLSLSYARHADPSQPVPPWHPPAPSFLAPCPHINPSPPPPRTPQADPSVPIRKALAALLGHLAVHHTGVQVLLLGNACVNTLLQDGASGVVREAVLAFACLLRGALALAALKVGSHGGWRDYHLGHCDRGHW